jgi:5,10-methylenetetrahydromethanopterin reductase
MRFGIRFIEYVGNAREVVNLSVKADQAGFDSVWFPHDPFMRNTWILTAAVAEHTSRIHIGSVGTNPYTTGPSEIATYLATLDELSEGRAILGLGLHTTEMVEWSGYDAGDYLQRTREATEIIRALLRGETVDYQGESFTWSDQCYLRFTPVRADVPIYIAGFGEAYNALSGEIGDGSLPMITPPESASYMVPAIHKGAVTAGRDPAEVDICACGWLSLSNDVTAAQDLLRPMVAYFAPYLEAPALATAGLDLADFNEVGRLITAQRYDDAYAAITEPMFRLGIVGTAKDVIARIETLAEMGVTHVNLGGPLGPDPEETIRIMGEEVIPYFRG